jgi:hypothetical protein
MPNLSIAESTLVVTSTTFINALLQLDDVWTEAVAVGSPTSEGEVGPWIEQLRILVDLMADELSNVGELRSQMSEVVNRHHEAADATLRTLLWGNALDGNVHEDLRWWVGNRGIRDLWNAADTSFSQWESEVEQLRGQLSVLEGGQAVAGDLTIGFRCGAANGLFTGGSFLFPRESAPV